MDFLLYEVSAQQGDAQCARLLEIELVAGDRLAAAGVGDRAVVLLRRIYRNADQLKPILDRDENRRAMADGPGDLAADAPGGPVLTRATADRARLPLTADEILTVRKVWEVGLEEVVMQTVIQLDGDVVTRVAPAAMAPDFEIGRDLHANAVTTAVTHWQFLGRTALDFLDTIFTRITSR